MTLYRGGGRALGGERMLSSFNPFQMLRTRADSSLIAGVSSEYGPNSRCIGEEGLVKEQNLRLTIGR